MFSPTNYMKLKNMNDLRAHQLPFYHVKCLLVFFLEQGLLVQFNQSCLLSISLHY